MNLEDEAWTNNITNTTDSKTMVTNLCFAFSNFPFMKHNALITQLINHSNDLRIECVTDKNDAHIGNVRYGILHGGVAATMLDSIGGIQTMSDLMIQGFERGDDMAEVMQTVTRVATLDLRIDYLKPGTGEQFTATSEIMRLGRRSSLARMQLTNEQGTKIAIATASFVY